MPKSPKPKSQPVTEEYVWGVVNYMHKDLSDRLDELNKKQEQRFNTVMTHLVDIAG